MSLGGGKSRSQERRRNKVGTTIANLSYLLASASCSRKNTLGKGVEKRERIKKGMGRGKLLKRN